MVCFHCRPDRARLAVIDTATPVVQHWIQLPALGYGSANTLSGRWLIVTPPDASLLAIIDTKSMRVARTVSVPKEPHEVLIAPDDRAAYVACTAAQAVVQLNLESWRATKNIKMGKLSGPRACTIGLSMVVEEYLQAVTRL